MHQKDKNNKHIAKLKYLKIGETPKSQYLEDDNINEVEVSVEQNHNSFFNKSPENVQLENPINQTNNNSNEPAVPGFLQKVFSSKDEPVDQTNLNIALQNPKDLKMLPFSQPKVEVNPNSFSSIFNKDHQEVFGVQRVFKKSVLFLVLHLLSFGLLAFTALNLFTLPIWWSIIIAMAYVVITNIFYIIVADRSYVWLSLTGQVILLLITQAFVGLSFDRVTLVFALLVTLFTYFAYGELEKVQLSSRLFSISHITSESIRILLTVVILVLCLGVFNKALSEGSENFISEAFLNKPFVVNDILIGKYKNLSLNRFVMQGRFYVDNNTVTSDSVSPSSGTNYTFADFLTANYRPGQDAMSADRKTQILNTCDKKTVKDCNTLVIQEKQTNLEGWRQEAYSNLPYTLDTVLTPAKFTEITKQFYVNEVKSLDASNTNSGSSDITDTLSKYLIVPRNYILPAFTALILFLLLTLIKFLLRLVTFWATYISWNILVLTGFAKIEIEKVEAEIVSI
jgi:hypothetical protein